MGSPLGLTLASVFLCYHEKIWLQNWPSQFKPVIYRRYVDDTFLLFRSKHHIEKFLYYLTQKFWYYSTQNIKFTSRTENENSISFLDIKITRDNNKFMTSVYRKSTFSRVFTNSGCCKYGYPKSFVDFCIKKYLDKVFIKMK